MGASRFVGRVGGLAVALGVGAAVFSAGQGVAWASGDDAGSQTQATGSSDTTSAPANRAARRGAATKSSAPKASAASRNNRGLPAVTPQVDVPDSSSAGTSTGHDASVNVAVDQSNSSTTPAVAPADNNTPAPVASRRNFAPLATVVVTDPAPAPVPAPSAAISSFLTNITNGLTGGLGGNPLTPVENPLSLTLLEASRRVGPAAANTNPQASAVANSTVTQGDLTVTPTFAFVDGIIQGTLGAVSSSGQTLSFSFVGTDGSSDKQGKMTIGNVPNSPTTTNPQSFTLLPYANWLNGTPNPTITGTQTFNVRVSEVTGFDKFLTGIPLLGMLASPIIGILQQAPLISGLLAPIIGSSVVAPIVVDLAATVPTGKNVAYTVKVTSFDGTEISTNFFPALDNSKVAAGNVAFTVLNGPGLGSPGATDPYGTSQAAGSAPGLGALRGGGGAQTGFNVITWDPRGEFASGGVLQLDNPMFEGRDVSALIDWAAKNTPAVPNALVDPQAPVIPNDIRVGMIGGSYGGGIQLTTVDPRIDTIVPAIAWNSLNDSLYPDQIFKTGWANTLFLSLLTSGARVNNQIPLGILTGDLFGFLSQTAQAVLGSSGPGNLLTKLSIPTLYQQGTVDALFPLDQALTNIQTQLTQNPYFATNPTAARMIWFCGGHGVCLDPTDKVAQATTMFTQDLTWLNAVLKAGQLPSATNPQSPLGYVPTFQYWDQLGNRWISSKLPTDPTFYSTTLNGLGKDGTLGILPFAFLGSGPNTTGGCDIAGAGACSFPLNQVFATPTNNSLSVDFTPSAGTKIVGAPTVSFDYKGLGTSKAVYAQVVDNKTGRVVGNIVSPIPVTLDGRSHTASVSIADIAYTAPPGGGSLSIQIVPSATLFWNTSFGVINISNISATLPTTIVPTSGQQQQQEN